MKGRVVLVHILLVLTSACAMVPATRVREVVSREQQTAMSPDQALARLLAGNERFWRGESRIHDFPAQFRASASGQFPFAAVLSCIDSRTPPELLFDAALGDLFAPRIAGNFVDDDMLGSLEFATELSGARLILVLGHTHCGAIKGACDNAELGHLTGVLAQLKPAVAATPSVNGPDRSSRNLDFVDAVVAENVRQTVANIRARSAVLRALEDRGRIRIVGAIYALDTGRVSLL